MREIKTSMEEKIRRLKSLKIISQMEIEDIDLWERLCKEYAHNLDTGSVYRDIAFTLHDFSHHCVDVYRILNMIAEIQIESKGVFLSKEESLILNVAVLFHDYSMCMEGTDRNNHALASAEYLKSQFSSQSFNSLAMQLKEIIPLVIQAHSDPKDRDDVENMKNPKLLSSLPGYWENDIRAKKIAAYLRLADELDITQDRLGKYVNKLPGLDENDEKQSESLRHWKRLKCYKNVIIRDSKIYLKIEDNIDNIDIQNTEERKKVLSEIITVKNKIRDTLQYLNELVFEKENCVFATDVIFEKSEIFSDMDLQTEIGEEQLVKIEKEELGLGKLSDMAKSSERKKGKEGEERLPHFLRNVQVLDSYVEKCVTNYVLDNELVIYGHYRLNRRYCGTDWIDVRRILQDKHIGNKIIETIKIDIRKIHDINKDNTIIIGNSMNGNIVAARLGFDLHMPFSYMTSNPVVQRGSIPEQQVDLNTYEKIILVTGVISTHESVQNIIREKKIGKKILRIYTILYRPIIGKGVPEDDSYLDLVHAINAKFTADIIRPRDCMLLKNGRCVAKNLLAFNQVLDEHGDWMDQPKLVYGDRKRIYINLTIGCEAKCDYCYVEDIRGAYPKNWMYGESDALEYIRFMDVFKGGQNGTILSFGCYSECLAEDSREQVIGLISKLAESKNYMQLATKKEITEDEIKDIDSNLMFEGQLVVYISLPTISNANKIEKRADEPEKRIRNFELKKIVHNVRFVLYLRPVLDNVTILDIDHYKNIMQKYKVPCVVGDRFKTNNERKLNTENLVGEGILREEKPHDVDEIVKELKTVGKVYRHSVEVIEDMRRTREDV